MAFELGDEPTEPPATELRVEETQDADAFALTLVEGYGMPAEAQGLFPPLVGLPGWRCFLAWSGDEPAGCGALYVEGRLAWLGMAATRPSHRRRGAQIALLLARIEAARALGADARLHRDRSCRRRRARAVVPQHPPRRLPRVVPAPELAQRMSRLGPLRHREFRLLFAGRTISMAGSAMAPVALAFAVLDLTGSTTDLGIVLAARQIPVLVLLLFGGVWADRLPRHHVMVASNIAQRREPGGRRRLLLTGHAQIWQLAVLAALNGASTAFFFPASSGIVPQTVTAPMLQQANATLRLALNATKITGAAIGGILVAATSPGIAIAIDAVSYFAAAACIAAMRVTAADRIPGAPSCTSCARAGTTSGRAPGSG